MVMDNLDDFYDDLLGSEVIPDTYSSLQRGNTSRNYYNAPQHKWV